MTPDDLTDAIIGALRDYSLEVGDLVEPQAFVRHLEKHGLMIVPIPSDSTTLRFTDTGVEVKPSLFDGQTDRFDPDADRD